MRGEGLAVETSCQVLREQSVAVAARTYRAWETPTRVLAARTVSDVVIVDSLITARTNAKGEAIPESLYGRPKMTALLRRQGLSVAHCTVDRLMGELAMFGISRGKTPRTTVPGKDGVRAGDLLNRDFTACAPNRVWIADFTACAPGRGSSTPGSSWTSSPSGSSSRGQQGHRSCAANWSTTATPGSSPRPGSPNTWSSRASRPPSGPSVTPTTTP